MSYTIKNFKTKRELKEAVSFWKMSEEKKQREPNSGYYDPQIVPVRCYNPGLGPDLSNYSGKVSLEGPHGFHKWYAQAELVDGIVVKVS